MTEIAHTLKPCPFCGTDDHLYRSYYSDGTNKPYAIDCVSCGYDFTPRDGMDVVEAWNRRAPDASQSAEIAALRDALEEIRDQELNHSADARCSCTDVDKLAEARSIARAALESRAILSDRSRIAGEAGEREGAPQTHLRGDLWDQLVVLSGYHITQPPTPDYEFVRICNGDLRKMVELMGKPVPHEKTVSRWRAFEDATPGYWGIELESAGNDDDAIMYPQKIHRDTVARIVEAHNAALATEGKV